MYELTAEAVAEYMETKKGVKAEKIEAYKYGSKTAYLVNENYRVAIETKGSVLPSSISTNYNPRINGRKITKSEYNRIKGDYELQQIKGANKVLNYYISKLERVNRKIDRLKDKLDFGNEITFNEQAALLIAEAEKRLLEEFIDDLKKIEE